MLVNSGQKQAKPKDFIAKKVVDLAPSGIRRFFDLLA